jgi:AraC-like DNA-binding protein/ketosteroid isomerase-like protein
VHPENFIRSYFDAWNRCDAKAVADHLTPNGTYSDMPRNQQLDRKALITSDLADLFTHERVRYELVGEVLYSEGTIAYQYRATPLDSAGDDVEGSSWFGAEFMVINGEAAVRIADYYELSSEVGRAADVIPGEPTATKYARSGLNDAQMERYKKRLLTFMGVEKIYLNSEMTLPALAGLMECSVNHLSQVINAGFGASFYDYLNSYRIEEAKRILGGDDSASQAILDIPFEVGFNTNSAFYAAFKKSTGQTPAQYRRKQLKLVAGD